MSAIGKQFVGSRKLSGFRQNSNTPLSSETDPLAPAILFLPGKPDIAQHFKTKIANDIIGYLIIVN